MKMMKIPFSFFIFLLLISVFLDCCAKETLPEEYQAAVNTNKIVYIIPLSDRSDASLQKNTGLYQTILFNSLYSFISIIPDISSPEKDKLTSLKSEEISTVESNIKPDFIVYGGYFLNGGGLNPEIGIMVMIKSRVSGESFSNTYLAPTDVGLFDSIDRISEDIGSFLTHEKAHIASLNFNNFKTGGYNYDLIVNKRRVARITNDGFSLGLKVISGKPYHIGLRRDIDGRMLIDDNVVLGPGEGTNISYVEKVAYRLNFDGDIIYDNMTSHNENGNLVVDYNYHMINNLGEKVYLSLTADSSNFIMEILDDGVEKGGKSLHMKGSTLRYDNFGVSGNLLKAIFSFSIVRIRLKSNKPIFNYGGWVLDSNNEFFYYRIGTEIKAGKWCTVSIPVNKFIRRTNYQPENAKYAPNFELPLHYIQIFTSDDYFNNRANFDVYIDSVEFVE